MRRLALPIATAGMGLLVGTLAGIRWIAALAAAEGPGNAVTGYLQAHAAAVAPTALLVVTAAAAVLWKGLQWRGAAALIAAFSLALAAVTYWALHTIFVAVLQAWQGSIAWIVGAGLLAAATGLLAGRPRFALAAALVGLGFTPACHYLHLVTGDELALAAINYWAPPSLEYCLQTALSLACLGALVGWWMALVTRGASGWCVALGAAGGIAASVAILAAQIAVFFAATGSGMDPATIAGASVAVWVAVAASAALAAQEWGRRGPSWVLRLAPAIVLLFVGAYVVVAAYGLSDYRALQKYHSDTIYAYIHFTPGGRWQRTVDDSGNTARTWRTERFLASYPNSAYRPAAMLLLAECQFDLWRFVDASRTLREHARRYPFLEGHRDVVGVLADLAAGRPGTLLRRTRADSYLAAWRRTQGSQLAAYSAEKQGLPYQALGYYAAYADYIRTRNSTAWTATEIAFGDSRAEGILDRLRKGAASRETGTVIASVTAAGQPVPGARVVLVQPHHDAALSTDSRQFTGAWTVPAWNGIWGVTGRDGVATIRNAPHGCYDLVLGLDFRATPRGYVVSTAVSGVAVNRKLTVIPPIDLVPAVRLRSPGSGACVPASTRLAWDDYPGATTYSVSVIALDDGWTGGRGGYTGPRGQTCWARSGIREPRTKLDASCFLNGHKGLAEGRSYMWIVYACGADRGRISSSEHYFDLAEPIFTVRQDAGAHNDECRPRPDKNGGTPR